MSEQNFDIVNVFNEHNYDIQNFNEVSQQILETVGQKLKQTKPWCIAVIFNDEQTSLNLNITYRQKKYIPDVLSFGNDENFVIEEFQDLGDVFICYPKAVQQHKEYEHSLIRELSFLFLHGLLHNLGYDHILPSEEKIMFELQNEVLETLKITRK